MLVNNETELNSVIAEINSGSVINTIDIQSSFSLTADTINITKSMNISSSNNSVITDGGYAALHIKRGAVVTLKMKITGSGMSIIDGSGEDSTLKGVTGGEIANLYVTNGGGLDVSLGENFTTAAVTVDAAIGAGANISGILNNTQPMTLSGGIITNPEGHGQMNDLTMLYESFFNLTSNSTFKAKKVTASNICQISSDGTARLDASEGIVAKSTSWVYNGRVQGVNVDTIMLEKGGLYTGAKGYQSTKGCNVGKVNNDKGTFDLGQKGNWNCGSYLHTDASLEAYLPNFNGDGPMLTIKDKGSFSGGTVDIHATIYYLPSHATGGSFVLISAPSGHMSGLHTDMVKFHNFPSGVKAQAVIENGQTGENDKLIIKLSIAT